MKVRRALLLCSATAALGLAAATLTSTPANARPMEYVPNLARPVPAATAAAGAAMASREASEASVEALAGTSYAGSERLADGATQIAVAQDGAANPALIRAARAAGISLKTVRYSEAQLSAWANSIDTKGSATQGIVISSLGPDYDHNAVVIRMTSYTAAAASQLQRAYPTIPIWVDPGNYPLATNYGRYNDSSPWTGGNALFVDSGNGTEQCSSGFTLISQNTYYMLTAGHCVFGQGTAYVGTTRQGPVESKISQSCQSQYCDEAIGPMNGAYGGLPMIWGGSPRTTNPTQRFVVEVGTGEKDKDNVCIDGATTGEVCGAQVTGVNQKVIFGDGSVLYGLTITKTASGAAKACRPGDSGAPVEVQIPTNGASARGMLSSGDGTSECFYYPIRKVLADFSPYLQVLVYSDEE